MADEINVYDLPEDEFEEKLEELLRTPVEEVEEQPNLDDPEPEPEEDEAEDDTAEETDEDEDEESETVEQDEDTEESEDDEPDEEIDTEDETDDTDTSTPAGTEDEEEKSEDKVEPYKFGDLPMDEVLPFEVKAAGSKMKVTLNELIKGFEKGIDYTQKLQNVAALRKVGNLMEEENLTQDDLNLLVEIKKGNVQAASKLMGNANIDSLELDPEQAKDYRPNNYGSEPVSLELESVRQRITSDTEILPKMETVLNTMPQSFFDEVAGQPNNLNSLYEDVKSGVYDEVAPEMYKMATLYGETPSVELYKKAAGIVAARMVPVEETKPQPKVNPVQEKQRAEKRKAAVSGTKKKASTKAPRVNFDDLDDSDFEKEFQRMTGRAISDYA